MHADPLSLAFSALAHPARRAILTRLGQGAASVQELSQPLALSPPAVTKHLKILERGGLISRTRNAQWRPCQIEKESMNEAMKWMEEVRALAEQRFDQLDSYLASLQTPATRAFPLPPSSAS